MEPTILTMAFNAAYNGFKDGVNDNNINSHKDDELPNHEIQELSWEKIINGYDISSLKKNNVPLLEVCKKKGVANPKTLILTKNVENVIESGISVIGSWLQNKTAIKMGHICISGLDDTLINLLVSRSPLTYRRALDILAGQGYEVIWFKNYEGSMINSGTTVSANMIVIKA